MSRLCEELHQLVNSQSRFYYPWEDSNIPENGIYFIFESGETAHGVDRIVMVGYHTGENQLRSRLKQHFVEKNKDRSYLRKTVGRCLLNIRGDEYSEVWEIDMTSIANRNRYGHLLSEEYQQRIEEEVSGFIRENFSFCVIRIEDKEKRLELKTKIISTISLCDECKPSINWLGNNSPREKIRQGGMWQEKDLYKEPLTIQDFEYIKSLCIHRE